MDVGRTFVAWCPSRGWVSAEVVWTGGLLLVDARSASVPMGSSLCAGASQQPSKPVGTRGRSSPRAGTGVSSRSRLS
jgi:hypothetical protein